MSQAVMALGLPDLPQLAFAFVLLLARIATACMLLPVIGEAEVPATVRLGFSLALVVLLLPALLPVLPPAPSQPLRVAGAVVAEIGTGLWLGWLARLVLMALPFAGQLAALATGLSSVIQPDPALGAQTAALGRLMGVVAPVIVLVTGLYRLPLMALAGSYDVIAPGTLLPAGDTAQSVVAGIGQMFALAVRLAAPFLLASLAFNASMALLVRLVPHLQLHALGASVQVLGGLLLLGLLMAAVLEAWHDRAAVLLGGLPGL
jgi:flagellar biosynthetic protein FliR